MAVVIGLCVAATSLSCAYRDVHLGHSVRLRTTIVQQKTGREPAVREHLNLKFFRCRVVLSRIKPLTRILQTLNELPDRFVVHLILLMGEREDAARLMLRVAVSR